MELFDSQGRATGFLRAAFYNGVSIKDYYLDSVGAHNRHGTRQSHIRVGRGLKI